MINTDWKRNCQSEVPFTDGHAGTLGQTPGTEANAGSPLSGSQSTDRVIKHEVKVKALDTTSFVFNAWQRSHENVTPAGKENVPVSTEKDGFEMYEVLEKKLIALHN